GDTPGPGDLRAGAPRRQVARGAQSLLAAPVPVRDGSRAAADGPPAVARTVLRRAARVDEAPILAEMANDLNDHVGISGRPFTAERVRADGFGGDAAFTPLVPDLDGQVVGYAFF